LEGFLSKTQIVNYARLEIGTTFNLVASFHRRTTMNRTLADSLAAFLFVISFLAIGYLACNGDTYGWDTWEQAGIGMIVAWSIAAGLIWRKREMSELPTTSAHEGANGEYGVCGDGVTRLRCTRPAGHV
jgi:hypothetical protein